MESGEKLWGACRLFCSKSFSLTAATKLDSRIQEMIGNTMVYECKIYDKHGNLKKEITSEEIKKIQMQNLLIKNLQSQLEKEFLRLRKKQKFLNQPSFIQTNAFNVVKFFIQDSIQQNTVRMNAKKSITTIIKGTKKLKTRFS